MFGPGLSRIRSGRVRFDLSKTSGSLSMIDIIKGDWIMAMLKKKTRKAISKTLKKAINKHGPTVAEHLATGLAAGLATYLGAEGKKGRKQIKKIAKSIPGGKKIARAVTKTVPALKGAADKLPTWNDNGDNKKGRGSKKSHSAS
jgi:hypothetical protein